MMRRMFCCVLVLCLLPALALAGSAKGKVDAVLVSENLEISGETYAGPLSVITAQPGIRIAQSGVVRTTQTDGVSPLYLAPDAGSEVLMTYYSGAPIQVLRQMGAFCQVQVGERGASVMGYMRAQDVAVGDTAERVVWPAYMELQFNREAQVYAYCDENAQVIGSCQPGKTYYAMGKNDDKWVQLYLPPVNHVWEEEERIEMGFVKLDTGLARGYWHELQSWTISPRAGEVTPQQVTALAIEHLTKTGNGSLPEIYTRKEALESMHSRVLYMQMAESLVNDWWVYFWENAGSDVVRVYVYVDGQGNVNMHHDYIAVGDEDAYSIRMTL